jgi:hypothetical protein
MINLGHSRLSTQQFFLGGLDKQKQRLSVEGPMEKTAQVQPGRGNPGLGRTTHRHVVPLSSASHGVLEDDPWVGSRDGEVSKNFVEQWKKHPLIDVSS